jgi:hypothetical protein
MRHDAFLNTHPGVLQSFPVRLDVELDALEGSVESEAANKKNGQDYVGKQSREINRLYKKRSNSL